MFQLMVSIPKKILITHGVPQESILGPDFVFLVFINDFPNAMIFLNILFLLMTAHCYFLYHTVTMGRLLERSIQN